MILNRVQNWWQSKQLHWLEKRIPGADEFSLDHKNIFIFPTSFGFLYLLLSLCLFLLGSNYQNNLMLLLCYFLLALFLVCLFSCYINIKGLRVKLGKCTPGFAGQNLYQGVWLESDTPPLGKFHLHYWQNKDLVSQEYCRHTQFKLAISFNSRGIYQLPRITIKNFYPLGLLKCWSHLAFPQKLVIYPTPRPAAIPSNTNSAHKDENGVQPSHVLGTDEFYSLEKHQRGQPMHHIDWKQMARGRGMLTKHFVSYQRQAIWLKLSPALGNDLEEQLQKLCFLVLDLSQKNQDFGLDLGHSKLPLACGEKHKELCLKSLAIYPRKLVDVEH